ncbi:rifampicin phosphotransferase-like isoform X2 [Dysidea avara]|uniref:rifampicin phosphotransferase-like isoform X2 n=1 Tax=Dysidea avara TaxID=196820 RepID=UPI003328880B
MKTPPAIPLRFETYLFQKGEQVILNAVKKCWASCFATRVMQHRIDCGLSTSNIQMAVVIQVMVNSETSGVAFSRHPLKPLTADSVLVEAVYGLGEGLVSGELEADSYEVSRNGYKVTKQITEKGEKLVQNESGGLKKVSVPETDQKASCLTDDQAQMIAKLLVDLEEKNGKPQDFEWAFEDGQLYCLQARPIVTLPCSFFFRPDARGSKAVLWDNSNIVESYSGVTTPLTFSFASRAYEQVYTLTLKTMGVPAKQIQEFQPYLSNMLGIIRGNVYYNLVNWYRLLSAFPIGDTSKFMETMMGVKQTLHPDIEAQLGAIKDTAPRYSLWAKMTVVLNTLYKMYTIDGLVVKFFDYFNQQYEAALGTDFEKMDLVNQMDYLKHIYKNVIGRWEVPIYNDIYVMFFFGLLKKYTGRWVVTGDSDDKVQSLQNDLLCGQGDVESTMPTKLLMEVAEYVDTHSVELKDWFLNNKEEVLTMLADKDNTELDSSAVPSHDTVRNRKKPQEAAGKPESSDAFTEAKKNVLLSIRLFLKRYGFRCINELKLEEKTLHDDPGFVLDMIAGYVRSGAYSIASMEKRESEIRKEAENVIQSTLRIHKRIFYNWVLFHARKGVKHRENLRFARTKIWGVIRNLFRGVGLNLYKLGIIKEKEDVFYLTVDELYAHVEGRSVTNNLAGIVELRKSEWTSYKKGLQPPERFMTTGAVGSYLLFPQLLDDLDLLRDLETEASSDPNVLKGVPCCPGVVDGIVRVVTNVEQAKGLNGEILVTARTDPGWVPLYPLCSGLIIERGSLLSHSAVVARELGLPTIVGVSGGLMKRLKSGMKVHLDAGKGKLTIIHDQLAQ